MFKVTLKGLFQHKLRFLLTTVAVIAGVSFVVAAFTLTDSVRSQFNQLFEDINANIDLTVRAEEKFDVGAFGQGAPVPADILAPIQEVPGVEAAEGSAGGVPALVIDAEGKAVEPLGGPPLGINWPPDESISQVTLAEGAAPQQDDEVVFDKSLFSASGYAIGDTVTVQTPAGNAEYRLVGSFSFGESNSLGGAYLVGFTTAEAQRVFNLVDRYQRIDVGVAPDADPEVVRAEIAELLPEGVEVVSTDQVVQESQDDFGSIVDIFGTVLLVFAFISLFVSAFLIFNTFLIVVGQRIREMALLRAVGASASQVAFSVIGEALVIGVLASIIGFVAGLGLSYVLNAVLSSAGFGGGESSLIVSPSAVVAAFAVGIGTTLLSSILPAVWATRIPPVAAMREGFKLSLGSVKVLGIIGTICAVIGGAAIAFALLGSADTAPMFIALGAGALVVFVGAALLSAALAGPVAHFLGLPFRRIFNVTGEMARQNAAREPSRTAFTAAALMIGLALVSMSFVVGGSLRESFVSSLRSSVSADWYVSPESFFGFSPEVSRAMAERDELTSVTGLRFGQMQVDGTTRQFSSGDYAVLPDVVDIGVVDGAIENTPGVLIKDEAAETLGVGVGDTLDVVFQETGVVQLPVLAVYEDSSIVGNWVIDSATYSQNFTDQTEFMVMAKTAPGFSDDQARAAIEEITVSYPQLNVRDREEFTASQEDQINQLLAVITVFLALAIIIAVIGIVNTMALSVFERTRELGLLRAVGMQRRQMRRMIRVEAVIVAVFGALLGVVIGAFFGVAIASALPDDIISIIDVPIGTFVVLVIIAALFGMVAAVYPAWRAGRLNVLEAIATE
jgi:putative ABC transport system permease protein